MIIACIICAVICGFLYQIWFCKRPPSPTKSCVKTMAIAALALAALLIGAPALLVAGLAFCALGDFWLSRDGERAFLIGLISFAIGHIFYILLFFNTAAAPLFLLEMPWLIGVAALMMAGGFMGRVLWPVTGALRIPVMAYIAIIITMGIAAIATTQNGANVVLIGAGIFIVSDIILSTELFLLPEKHKLRRVTPPIRMDILLVRPSGNIFRHRHCLDFARHGLPFPCLKYGLKTSCNNGPAICLFSKNLKPNYLSRLPSWKKGWMRLLKTAAKRKLRRQNQYQLMKQLTRPT